MRLSPMAKSSWCDPKRPLQLVSRTSETVLTATCEARPVRHDVKNSEPYIHGLDLGAIAAISSWGISHIPFISVSPKETL